jgi:hypothetical protein
VRLYYFAAFAFPVRVPCSPREPEPKRFLKQARQRASRRFLNNGARSSLPQYRQTNGSILEAVRDG